MPADGVLRRSRSRSHARGLRVLSLSTPLAAWLLFTGCRKNTLPEYPEGYREYAYVANNAGNTVTVLDLVYLRVDRTLKVGAAPIAVVANPHVDEAYVLTSPPDDATGSLTIVNTAANTITASIALHRGPAALALSPEGKFAYVVNRGSNALTLVDLPARRATGSFPTGSLPGGVGASPDGRTVVVTNAGSGSASVFAAGIGVTPGDPGRPSLRLRATFTGCPGASSPVILPDSSKVFVACTGSRQVMAVGLSQAAETWAAKQDSSLMTDRMLAMLDVGQEPAHLSLKPDGGEIFVSNRASDTVSEISTQTNEVGSTYSIGNRPAEGIVSGDNSALWVAASGADSLSLYSIDDGKFVSSIRTGVAPGALAFSADEHLLLAADARSGDVAVIRTTSRLGPALLTILPVGGNPVALAVKAMKSSP